MLSVVFNMYLWKCTCIYHSKRRVHRCMHLLLAYILVQFYIISSQPFARWKLGSSFPSSSQLEYESVSQEDTRSFKGRISNEVLVFYSNKDILPGMHLFS